jgi:hypothetical protein
MVSDTSFHDLYDRSPHPWGSQTSRAVLPPPVVIPAPGTARLGPHVTIGDVRLADARVHARARELAERARALGVGHSLRVWRDAHYHALVQLACEAAGLATGVRCEMLTWQRHGDTYYISATFVVPTTAIH